MSTAAPTDAPAAKRALSKRSTPAAAVLRHARIWLAEYGQDMAGYASTHGLDLDELFHACGYALRNPACPAPRPAVGATPTSPTPPT